MRVSIYAANLHHGGGATGAATFIADLPALLEAGDLAGISELEVVASTTVAQNVPNLSEVERTPGVRVEVRDDYPRIGALFRARQGTQFDVQFVVRGPHYAPLSARRTVLGFADATMYFPDPVGVVQSGRTRVLHLVKNQVKRRLMPHYDAYVVQSERLAEQVRSHVPGRQVRIVPNSPSPIFMRATGSRTVKLPPRRRDAIRLFYPARAYTHKNHALIGPTADYLEREHHLQLEVVTTLRDSELSGLSESVRNRCINVGEIGLDECPGIYADCDGVFFPSLNETWSVTPLEGMIMGRPVLASDRDFNRDTAGAVPFYFDPLDPKSAGDAVLEVFGSGKDWSSRLACGEEYVRSLPSAFDRSRAYLRIVVDLAAG